jgi:hypothetical protein
MGFFSFLKCTFIIFAAHTATSCGAPFENHWYIYTLIHTHTHTHTLNREIIFGRY